MSYGDVSGVIARSGTERIHLLSRWNRGGFQKLQRGRARLRRPNLGDFSSRV